MKTKYNYKFLMLILLAATIGLIFSLVYAVQPGIKTYSCFDSVCTVYNTCEGTTGEQTGCKISCKDTKGNVIDSADCTASAH